MRNAAWSSSPRKPDSLKRSRTLKRGGIRFEPLADDHIKYAWAAYRRGAFEKVAKLPDAMDRDGFLMRFIEMVNEAANQHTESWTVFGKTSHGVIPIAFLTIGFSYTPWHKLASPHVIWYPEASARNMIEAGVLMFRELKKEAMVMVTPHAEDDPYFRHLAKYGLLRVVGKVRDYFGDGEHGTLFQSVGK